MRKASLRLCISTLLPMQSQAKQLDTATFGYDFRETSSSSHESVVKKVKKSDISATFDHQGKIFF